MPTHADSQNKQAKEGQPGPPVFEGSNLSYADSHKNNNGSTFQFADNRPEAKRTAQLRDMANNSPQAKRTAQLQKLAHTRSTAPYTFFAKEKNSALANATQPDSAQKHGLANGVIQRKIIFKGEGITIEVAKKLIKDITTLTPTMERVLEDFAGDEILTGGDEKQLAFNLKTAVAKKLGITDKERAALDSYQGGGYTELNEALRGSSLSAKYGKIEMTQPILSALAKLPKPTGMVYRMLSFNTAREYNAFINSMVNTTEVLTTPQFDSTKTLAGGKVDLVEKPFKLNMRIQACGEFGGDIASVISTVPDRENEVLFPPGTMYGILGAPPTPIAENETTVNTSVELAVIGLDQEVQNASMPTRKQVNASLFQTNSKADNTPKKKVSSEI